MGIVHCITVNHIDGSIKESSFEATEEQWETFANVVDDILNNLREEEKKDDKSKSRDKKLILD